MELARSKNKKVRIRVTAGTLAPDYAKKIGGAPIPFYDHQRKKELTIGRFWTDAYQTRWQLLQKKLAAKYDGDPAVAEVNIAGTGMISAEVMMSMENDKVPSTGKLNKEMLAAEGLTEPLRREYLMKDIYFMQDTWKRTHTTLWSAPYDAFNTSSGPSLATTKEIINAVHNRKPGATTFGHTGIAETTINGEAHAAALEMYLWLESKRYPFTIQTQSYDGGHGINDGVGNLGYVLNWSANHNIMAVELPNGWINDAKALPVLSTTGVKLTNNAVKTRILYYGS